VKPGPGGYYQCIDFASLQALASVTRYDFLILTGRLICDFFLFLLGK